MDFENFKTIVANDLTYSQDNAAFTQDGSIYRYKTSAHGSYSFNVSAGEWSLTPVSTKTTGYGRTLTEAAEDSAEKYSRKLDFAIRAERLDCN